MENFRKNGVVTTSMLLGFVVTVVLSMAGSIYATSAKTDDRIDAKTEELREANLDKERRVSRLEEAVETIKKDSTEIKTDIKMILKEVQKND